MKDCGSANLTVKVCYAPTEAAPNNEEDMFYNQLQPLLDRGSTRDITIVMGNLNAKVGPFIQSDGEIVGRHGLSIRNNSGTRFVDLRQRSD